ncbi:MAG: peptide chain release factor N(5)-glutamine methyltransferase [Candidatus Limnocylindrales bacterium]
MGSEIGVPLTVTSLLRGAAETLRTSGSESARLDAELLLGHVIRAERTALLAAPDAPVGADHAQIFRELVARRADGEPVAYIRGLKEFYGLALSVDPRALIPRPETELLVELGIDRLLRLLTEHARPPDADPIVAWDVATGSGAVCVALAVESRRRGYVPEVRFRATDISADAIALATENAVAHGVADSIDLAVVDLADLADLASPGASSADLLLANLPYIPTAVVPNLPVAASYEPVLALDGGIDGLELVRRLISLLESAVRNGGVALLEIGAGQADEVRTATAEALPTWDVEFHPDLAGVPRVVELSRGSGQ